MTERKRLDNILNEIIQKPATPLNKDEARQILQNCGILDENGEIMPAYRGIVVRRSDDRK